MVTGGLVHAGTTKRARTDQEIKMARTAATLESFFMAVGESRFIQKNRKLPYWQCVLNACSVFCINEAMVIGPTPPGTGVIHEARGATSAKCTSPSIL